MNNNLEDNLKLFAYYSARGPKKCLAGLDSFVPTKKSTPKFENSFKKKKLS